jgi:MSHA pilin protein MshD
MQYSNRPIRSSPRRGGLTMVEVMFAVVIMATMLTAAFGAVAATAKSRIAQQESAFGLALAKQLMAEIMQTRYQDLVNPGFGTESGETSRSLYDDVDDYDGYAENSASYANGTAITGGTGWKRKAQVDWVTLLDPTSKSNSETGLKRIIVKVTSPTKKVTTLTAYRSNYDRYEVIPSSQMTYTCWAGISIQVGTGTTGRNVQGVNLVNLSP